MAAWSVQGVERHRIMSEEVVDFSDVKNAACVFLEKKGKFERVKEKFEDCKDEFLKVAKEYFISKGIQKAEFQSGRGEVESTVTVTMVQTAKVIFDIDKLKKAVGKKLSKRIIKRQYEIVDIDGLIVYLQDCGVDPSVFKSFLNVTEEVDEDELDQLEQLGKIDRGQIKECYTVQKNEPYFRVTEKQNGEGRKER